MPRLQGTLRIYRRKRMTIEQQISAKEFSLAIAFESKEVNETNVDKILVVADKVYEWYIKELPNNWSESK